MLLQTRWRHHMMVALERTAFELKGRIHTGQCETYHVIHILCCLLDNGRLR